MDKPGQQKEPNFPAYAAFMLVVGVFLALLGYSVLTVDGQKLNWLGIGICGGGLFMVMRSWVVASVLYKQSRGKEALWSIARILGAELGRIR